MSLLSVDGVELSLDRMPCAISQTSRADWVSLDVESLRSLLLWPTALSSGVIDDNVLWLMEDFAVEQCATWGRASGSSGEMAVAELGRGLILGICQVFRSPMVLGQLLQRFIDIFAAESWPREAGVGAGGGQKA